MVSGANRGIGLAISKALAEASYRLSLGVRNPDSIGVDLGEDALIQRYDAASPADARSWVDATIAAFGRIDVLVNNAGTAEFVGLMPSGDDAESAEAALDRLLDINVKAPFRLVRAAMPHLAATGSGRIITLASLSGKRVLGLNAGYQISKHAALALSHAARRAGWDQGVRATAVCPGFVATDMTKDRPELDAAEITQPEDLARLVVDILKLPNTASVAELLVNWRYEASL
jgi:NAD(P)-dependent dehydrogenase (short-subunit alcohol dehydrogenase family)